MHSRLQSKVVALDAKVDTLMLPSIFSQLPVTGFVCHRLRHVERADQRTLAGFARRM